MPACGWIKRWWGVSNLETKPKLQRREYMQKRTRSNNHDILIQPGATVSARCITIAGLGLLWIKFYRTHTHWAWCQCVCVCVQQPDACVLAWVLAELLNRGAWTGGGPRPPAPPAPPASTFRWKVSSTSATHSQKHPQGQETTMLSLEESKILLDTICHSNKLQFRRTDC